MNDKEREQAIDTAFQKFQMAKTPAGRKHFWKEVESLVKGRSQEQIEKMEKEKGLCP